MPVLDHFRKKSVGDYISQKWPQDKISWLYWLEKRPVWHQLFSFEELLLIELERQIEAELSSISRLIKSKIFPLIMQEGESGEVIYNSSSEFTSTLSYYSIILNRLLDLIDADIRHRSLHEPAY